MQLLYNKQSEKKVLGLLTGYPKPISQLVIYAYFDKSNVLCLGKYIFVKSHTEI
jgi:hypothetical protein